MKCILKLTFKASKKCSYQFKKKDYIASCASFLIHVYLRSKWLWNYIDHVPDLKKLRNEKSVSSFLSLAVRLYFRDRSPFENQTFVLSIPPLKASPLITVFKKPKRGFCNLFKNSIIHLYFIDWEIWVLQFNSNF